MRLIDADAFRRELDNHWPFTKEEQSKHGIADLAKSEVLIVLNQMPTIEERKWIPCSERLPEVHESGNSFSGVYMQSDPVLVYGVCEYEENARFHIVTYCDDLDGNTYWSTELDALTITKVVAWMPLPEPYKEGNT